MTQHRAKRNARKANGRAKKAGSLPSAIDRLGDATDESSNGGLSSENTPLSNPLLRMAVLEQTFKDELADSPTIEDRAAPTRKTKPDKIPIKKSSYKLSSDDLERINTNRGLQELLKSKNIKLRDIVSTLKYEEELVALQIELVKLQRWVQEKGRRIAILFEGRDAAGKGGTIRRFTEHLNPRNIRVIALPKPTVEETGQWYFQRYSKHLPNPGEIVFFDRSWYNRAVVEPVNKVLHSKRIRALHATGARV